MNDNRTKLRELVKNDAFIIVVIIMVAGAIGKFTGLISPNVVDFAFFSILGFSLGRIHSRHVRSR